LADRWRALLLLLLLLSLPLVTHRVYASDEVQYFAYLRSVWFDGDLDFTNEYRHFIDLYPTSLAGLKQTNLDRLGPQGEPLPSRTGLPLNFGPIGSAVLWVPFYAIGHLVALLWHSLDPRLPVDGYALPYIVAITTGSAVYSGLGLLLLYRLATGYVSQVATFWATLGLWLGSPVIFYSHGAPAYSHAGSLFAVSLLLTVWQATRPLLTRRWWHWLWLGLLAGLVSSIREQDAIVPVAILAAELLTSRWWAAVDRHRLPRLLGGGGLMLGAWLLALLPQVASYCLLNGTCLPDRNVTQKLEYGATTGGFIGNVYLVSLSPEYGLLFWTPLVAPALLGLLWLWRRDRTLTLALVFSLLATWLVNSVYSTGPTRGSFGARRFLNCTPVFLLGLAAAYQALQERRLSPLVPLLTLLGCWWNLGLIVQFALNLMNRQRLELAVILYNQLFVVPTRLAEIAYRLLLARGSLFKN
jgi:hypothetical protein